jgi:5'-phosphate synthase pdxT subunit
LGDLAVGVLAVQGDVREHLAALAACDVVARPVRRVSELDEVHALVIPGGESTAISNLCVSFGLAEPIRERVAAGMPAYGSCAGMIMLATDVLDGRPDQLSFAGIEMTVRRNAFGRQIDSFEAPVEFAGLDGEPVHAVFIRAPWVESVGERVEVLGRVAAGPAMGRIVAVRQGSLLATSFHPELTGDLRVHRLFVDMARDAVAGAGATVTKTSEG